MAIQIISKDILVAKTPRVKRSRLVIKHEEQDGPDIHTNHVQYKQPDNLDIYGDPKPIAAVEVDVKRNYAVDKVETANLQSDTISTKVNNKVDKLRALRNGN